jgi:arylsulfatase A-like enzyme
MYRKKYICFLFFLLFGGRFLLGCSEERHPSSPPPEPPKPVDYSFYRFINHLDEAVELSKPGQDINNRIVNSVQTILHQTTLTPVKEKMAAREVDFSAAGAVGAIRKFSLWAPAEGGPGGDGIASVRLRFKDEGKVAGLIFRYSEKSFYLCGLQSGPKSSLFLMRYYDDSVTIIDYSEVPVAIEQDFTLTVNYHEQFFELILNNSLFRIVHDADEPFSGTIGYFTNDSVNALVEDLKTAKIASPAKAEETAETDSIGFSIEDRPDNMIDEITKWEQLLFYRHDRLNFDLNPRKRDYSIKSELNGETRPAFFLLPESKIRFRIKIPPSGRLDYGLGLPHELDRRKKMTFRLGWEAVGKPERELARVDLGEEKSGRWIDQSVDLLPLAGQEGIISFQALLTEPGSPAATALVVSNPLLRSNVPDDKPNIIIYAVNSLRRDSLGVYGNKANLSPHLDQWAQSATIFDRAYAQAPWVKPSLASVFLSQYPMVHTILQLPDKILSEYNTLADWLAKSGYVTACFSENVIIGPGSGIDQGFDRVFTSAEPDRIRSFIAQQDRSPFFLFVHPEEPQRPYHPSKKTLKRFPSLTSKKISRINDSLIQLRRLAGQNYQRRGTDLSYDNSEEQTKIMDKIRSSLDDYKKLYQAEIAQMDQQFGQLTEIVDQSLRKDNTFLAFFSAHGEEFFEHASGLDGDSLYQELIHVPFILSWPQRWKEQRRISSPIELIDLLPTLMELINENKPVGTQGTSLVPLLQGLTLNKDIWSSRINL